jgi:hypothetical protein
LGTAVHGQGDAPVHVLPMVAAAQHKHHVIIQFLHIARHFLQYPQCRAFLLL